MRTILMQALDALDQLTDKVDGTGFSSSNEFSNALDVISFIKQELAKPGPEPVGYVNTDEFDNMLDDRDATLSPVKTGWYSRPLYAAPTEPNCKFPVCHSQEYQDKLVQEILSPEPVAWMVYFDSRLGNARVTDKLLVWRSDQAEEQVNPDLIQKVVPLYTRGSA